ncbi:MAG: glucuronyl hydrolase, partial [Ferruginibacter sp.]
MRFCLAFLFSFLISAASNAQNINMRQVITDVQKQAQQMLLEIPLAKAAVKDTNLVAPRTIENGNLKMVDAKDWTSGFFAGELWYLYDLTNNDFWKQQAKLFTQKIEGQQYDRSTHDLGFEIYCSVGNAYKDTKKATYKNIIIQAAKTLSTRFSPVTGTIKSWDNKKWGFPVIIDNMMNLELLFEATKLSGDSSFYKIAVTHANSTIRNHFRMDYSSYHVVDYDTV